MMFNYDQEPPAAAPDWVLTYGDMMSLLLTFFVMLFSMCEIRHNDRFLGVAESLQGQFGRADAETGRPGQPRPRNARLAAVSAEGRRQRRQTLEGPQVPLVSQETVRTASRLPPVTSATIQKR